MTTGDIKNNIKKLISELKHVSYDINTLDYDAISHGITSAFLPIIHHVFLDYSQNIASYLATKNYELYARTDLRFVEIVYKILMQEFSYKPSLKKEQFLALGFAERKVILLIDIVKFCREKNKSISKGKKRPIRSEKSSRVTLSSNQSNTTALSNFLDKTANELHVDGDKKVNNSILKKDKLFLSSTERDKHLKKNEGVCLPTTASPKAENTKIRHQRPVPDLQKLGWHNRLDSESTIPKPCDCLTVTPLKDFEMMQEDVKIVPGKSRADGIEIKDIERNGFKKIGCKIIMDEHEKPQGDFLQDEHGTTTYSSENSLDHSVKQKSDSIVSKQDGPDVTSSSECRRKCNEVEKLQHQMKSLETSLKDLVTINNKLSTRIVLLETHNILMEKRIESLTATTSNDQSSSELAASGKSTKDQQINVKKHWKHKRDEVGVHQRKRIDKYFPDKYVDFHNSIPEDFQPIKVPNMTKKDGGNDIENDLRHGKSEVDEGGKVIVTAEKSEARGSLREKISYDDGKEVLSPLCENERSFMEEETWATVLNLQKKLEETMKLFNANRKSEF